MAERPNPDDFDSTLRRALDDVAAATRPAPDLADRLITNSRTGRRVVVSLGTRRRIGRWAPPLLAAAAVALLAAGAAVGVTALADRHHVAPATQLPRPTPAPTPARTVPVHFRAVDVHMSDPSHAWALGDARCARSAANNCPSLIATTDAGSSWRAITLPAGLVSTFDFASCGTNGDLSGPCVDRVFFADARHGYVWSLHEFYGTTDGGRTWTRVAHRRDAWAGATEVAAVGRTAVRLAVVAQCSAGCRGAIQVAPVGSTKWRTVPTGPKPPALYQSMLAVHGGDVYLFAGETADSASAGILRSSDGGHTWATVSAHPCGPATANNDPFFPAQGAVAGTGAVVAQCIDRGVRTAAAGSSTFSTLRLFPHPSESDHEIVYAQSADRMLVCLGAGDQSIAALYATADGGRTWSQRTRPDGLAGYLRFVSASDGYVLGADHASVLVTHDGGVSWRRVTLG